MSGDSAGLAVVGARGRMGELIISLAADTDPRLKVAAKIDEGGPCLADIEPGEVGCVIDFSVREQAGRTATYCAEHGIGLVMGTTGLDPEALETLEWAAERAPVVFAPNFSVGINLLLALVGRAASLLGDGFDIEVVEAHHRHKVDAPSGTARGLGERLAESRGWSYADVVRCGREGIVGQRPSKQIGMSVVRGGSVVGEHTVHYLGEGEEVVIAHRALDRSIFARGALRAAGWILFERRPGPGMYSMADVLGVG